MRFMSILLIGEHDSLAAGFSAYCRARALSVLEVRSSNDVKASIYYDNDDASVEFTFRGMPVDFVSGVWFFGFPILKDEVTEEDRTYAESEHIAFWITALSMAKVPVLGRPHPSGLRNTVSHGFVLRGMIASALGVKVSREILSFEDVPVSTARSGDGRRDESTRSGVTPLVQSLLTEGKRYGALFLGPEILYFSVGEDCSLQERVSPSEQTECSVLKVRHWLRDDYGVLYYTDRDNEFIVLGYVPRPPERVLRGALTDVFSVAADFLTSGTRRDLVMGCANVTPMFQTEGR